MAKVFSLLASFTVGGNLARAWTFIIAIAAIVSSCNIAPAWHTFLSDDYHTGYYPSAAPYSCNPIFKFRTLSEVRGSASIFGGCAYFGTDDGTIYAINSTTGALLWSYATNGSIEATPYATSDRLYVGSYDGFMYALERSMGTLAWRFDAGSAIRGACAFDGNVYFGTEEGKLFALSSSGSELWNFSANASIGASPIISNGHVIVGSHDSFLYSINSTDGMLDWSSQLYSMQSSPMIAPLHPGKIFVGADDGMLYCINVSDGSVAWRSALGAPIVSTPSCMNGTIYFGDYAGRVHAVNSTTGSELWSRSVGGTILSSVALADGKLYFTSLDGFVHCISDDNVLLWRYELGNSRSTPSIDNGIVYVGARTGLYAFGLGEYTPVERVLRFTEAGEHVFNITLPAGCIVNSAVISIMPSCFVDCARAPAIDVGDDGTFEWQFPRAEYGRLGFQDRFSSGLDEETLVFRDAGAQNLTFYLPSGANVSSARLHLSLLAPPACISNACEYRIADELVDIAACDIDGDDANDYVTLDGNGNLRIFNSTANTTIAQNVSAFDILGSQMLALNYSGALSSYVNGSWEGLCSIGHSTNIEASAGMICMVDDTQRNLSVVRNYTSSPVSETVRYDRPITAVHIADLANDSKPETIVGYEGGISILNDSLCNEMNNITISSEVRGLDTADVDGDGMLDIAVVTSSGMLLLFRSADGMQAPSIIELGDEASGLALEDLNGDSKPDAVGVAGDYMFACSNVEGRLTQGALSFLYLGANLTSADARRTNACAIGNGTLFVVEATHPPSNPTFEITCGGTLAYSGDATQATIDFTDHMALSHAFDENDNCFDRMDVVVEANARCAISARLGIDYSATLHTGDISSALNAFAARQGNATCNITVPVALSASSPGKVDVNWILDYDFPPVINEITNISASYNASQAIHFNVSASDPDGGALYYEWFSNISGFLSNKSAFDVALPAGEHLVTVNVTDTRNHTISRTIIVVVNAISNNLPVIVLTKPVESTFAHNTSIQFDASSSYDVDGDALAYSWVSNVSGKIGSTPSFSFILSEGMHRINLTVSDGKANVSLELLLVVMPPPYVAPTITIGTPSEGTSLGGMIYINGTAAFASGSIKRVDYRIDGMAWAQASGDSSWSIVWNTTKGDNGAHTIEVRAFDGIEYSNAAVCHIVVNNNHPPVANFTLPKKVAAKQSAKFDASSSYDPDGDMLEYTWYFGDGILMRGIKVSHEYSKSGRFELRLVVNDSIAESEKKATVSVEDAGSTPGFGAALAIVAVCLIAIRKLKR